MAWIEVIKEDKATGLLKEEYDKITKRTKAPVDNILTIHSLHPETLIAHNMLYEELMHNEGPLSRKQREMIGVVVSAANSCEY